MTKPTSKKQQSSAIVALRDNSVTPEDIPALLDVVAEKVKEIKGDADQAFQTEHDLPTFGRVQTIEKPETLIKAYAYVLEKESFYAQAVKDMGVKDSLECTVSFHKPEQWYSDIKKRYIVVTQKDKLDKLEKFKLELEKNLSEEMRFQQSMKNATTILTSE